MKIFLSAIENSSCYKNGQYKTFVEYFMNEVHKGKKMKWNLMSYFYIRKRTHIAEYVRDNSEGILIDSGAHSLQTGKKVDWVEYTKEYMEFIKKFDRPNVVGYFEMDVDNIIGYDKVLELRRMLESVSDKIIPVWHKNRGIEEYKKMCRDYSGKVIAITGLKADIKEDQYMMFLKYAKKYNCKVHCLGMTKKKILDKIPFDYVDSSSWVQDSIFGRVGKDKRKVTREFSRVNRHVVFEKNYLEWMRKQDYYYRKWQHVCKD